MILWYIVVAIFTLTFKGRKCRYYVLNQNMLVVVNITHKFKNIPYLLI